MQWLRLGRAILAAVLSSAVLAGNAHAETLEFGWSGTVSAVDPAFAAALPAGSGITLGSPAFVRFHFESTTPDQDPSTTAGDYAGALTSFRLQVGSLEFTQQLEAPSNSIVVVSDPLFAFYEPQTSIDPSSPISGFPDLRGDVLFIPNTVEQIPDDSLFLTPPDPPLWSTASSAVLDPGGAVLLDVQLDAICVGACQPPDLGAPVPALGGYGLALLAAGIGTIGYRAARRQAPRPM
jgi:hypothetical protein